MMSGNVETLKQGTWLYDGLVACGIRIVVQDWDYYYEEDFDKDPPDLNDSGEAFYVMYEAPTGTYWIRSRTCLSLDKAIELAESTVPGPIDWSS